MIPMDTRRIAADIIIFPTFPYTPLLLTSSCITGQRVYIACDQCDEWYHAECVGLTSQQAATHAGTYICPRCTELSPPDPLAQRKTEERPNLKKEDSNNTMKTLYETALTASLQSQLAVLLRELQVCHASILILFYLDVSPEDCDRSMKFLSFVSTSLFSSRPVHRRIKWHGLSSSCRIPTNIQPSNPWRIQKVSDHCFVKVTKVVSFYMLET